MNRSGQRLLLFAAVAVAMAFAFKALGTIQLTSLWEDELASCVKAFQPSLRFLVRYLKTDVHPPLYYLLLWLAGHLFGQSTMVLRGLSWLAWIGSAVVLACTCWVWPRQPRAKAIAGAIAFVLLLSLPISVRYAVEGKGYSLLVLLVCLGLQQRQRLLRAEAGAALPCAIAWSAAALTHYYGMGLLLCLAAVDIARGRPTWRPLAWALVAPTLWTLWTLPHLLGTGGRTWIPPLSPALIRSMLRLGLGEHWPIVLALLAGTLLLLRPGDLRGPVSGWGLDGGVLLLLSTLAVSLWRPSLVARYTIVLVPGLLGLICSWLGIRLAEQPREPWKRWWVSIALGACLALFWSDSFTAINPRGAWPEGKFPGSREDADFRALAVMAGPEALKLAPWSQCPWLQAYDRLLLQENLLQPQVPWLCLPREHQAAAAVAAASGPRFFLGTGRPVSADTLEELRPILEPLRARGWSCREDPRSNALARGFHCRHPEA